MVRALLFAGAALAALSPFPAAAQNDDPIVVTATGLDDPLADAAFNVTTLDREALVREPSGRVENILAQAAGFQLFRVSDSRSANPTSQGATFRGLGGNASSRALLVVDGVPQSDPFGGWISWPAYDARNLGRIRITRGGGSGVYGSGALSGTIEIDSGSVENFQPARAHLAYGSRDSWDMGLGIMLPPSPNSLIDFSIHGTRGDGFVPVIDGQRGPIDEPAYYDQYGGQMRIIAPIGRVEFQASGRYFEDVRSGGLPMTENRTRGFDGSIRLLGRDAWQWDALFYVQTRNLRSSFASVDDTRTEARQVLDQFSVPSTGIGGRFEVRPPLSDDDVELRLGADYRETDGRTRERFFFVDGDPTRRREAGGLTRITGAFAEATVRAAPSLTLTGSGRVDRWWIENGFFRQGDIGGPLGDETLYADRGDWRFTGRAGLAWRPDNPVTVRLAGYTGWRLPTLNELYRPFRVGNDVTGANPMLAPEELTGAEIGVDFRPSSVVDVSATLFANRLEDGIANVTIGQGPGFFPGIGFVPDGGLARQRRNLDAIESAGLELDASARFDQWSLRFSYAYTDAEVEASGVAAPLDGLRPAQVARHNAAATLAYIEEFRGEAAITLRYVGSRFEDDLNAVRLNDAFVVGARALLPLYGPLQIELRAENLFDARVEAQRDADGLIERAMPQSFWAGLRFAFF